MPVEDARVRLYCDVVNGNVRSARAGKYLTIDEAQAIEPPDAHTAQFSSALVRGEIGLPPDLDLLVADADRLYGRTYLRFAPIPAPPSSAGVLKSRRGGPPPTKREAAMAAMRDAIEQGRLSADDLRRKTWKELATFCGSDVRRTTVRDARAALVAEFRTPATE